MPLFDFHSSFWVNLHQLLFHEALQSLGKSDRRLQSDTPISAPGMSPQDEATWNAAIRFYASHFGTRRQVFDGELIRINDALATQPDNGATMNPTGLPPDLVAALQSAAPVYRKYWWAVHNQSNEHWIASQRDRVGQLGPGVAVAMTKDLHQQWPSVPVRVDVCYDVAEIGHAYTTDPHTTLSSSAPTLQDLNGFELLFHEASHTFADTLTDALSAECRAQKRECGDLWHSVLFYTSGVEVRRKLSSDEQASFTPYAYRYGLYTRGDWPNDRQVLEKDWQKYLDGRVDFASAIRAMVTDLPPRGRSTGTE